MACYLAVDVGASGGRHVLGWIENNTLTISEIYRFPNGMINKGNQLCWDIDLLYAEILTGMKKCAQAGKFPSSVGIDTWGVDFVLLDKFGERIGDAVGYRDARTNGMPQVVYSLLSEETLYNKTGIAKQVFNTIFQLTAIAQKQPQTLQMADCMLFLPDYLHYKLCGAKKTEYTVASTSGLLNAETRNWDEDIVRRCGFSAKLFQEIVPPGTIIGELTEDVRREVGFSCKVTLPASHDTASAVVAMPVSSTAENTSDPLYISSGTWSLMGLERQKTDCRPESREASFTNEGGYGQTIRYLKNIMGLWMIQSVRKELNDVFSFAQLGELAAGHAGNFALDCLDCGDDRFLAPQSMIAEIQAACLQAGKFKPQTPGELAAVIYHSLARCYQSTALELERLTGQTFDRIHIMGGGSNADYLNQLTAHLTGKTVLAGPSEATAIGNLAVQMIAAGELPGLTAAREMIRRSFEIKYFHSKD